MILYISHILAFIFICIACYTDATRYQIPNKLSLLPYLTGIALHLIQFSGYEFLKATLTALVMFVCLIMLYLFKGLGAGDVKFLTGLSFLVETTQLASIVLYSFLLAGLMASVIYSLKYIVNQLQKLTIKMKWTTIQEQLLKSKVKSLLALKQIPFMIVVLPAFLLQWCTEVIV